MKCSLRLLAAVMFFAAIVSVNSSASSLVCSAGPTSIKTGNNAYQVIYTCTIPANTVSTNRSIRLNTFVLGSANTTITTEVTLDGVVILNYTRNYMHYWDLTIMNTGATTAVATGIMPLSVYSGMQPWYASVSGVSWASAQSLQVSFSSTTSGTAQGMTFTVENVN